MISLGLWKSDASCSDKDCRASGDEKSGVGVFSICKGLNGRSTVENSLNDSIDS